MAVVVILKKKEKKKENDCSIKYHKNINIQVGK